MKRSWVNWLLVLVAIFGLTGAGVATAQTDQTGRRDPRYVTRDERELRRVSAEDQDAVRKTLLEYVDYDIAAIWNDREFPDGDSTGGVIGWEYVPTSAIGYPDGSPSPSSLETIAGRFNRSTVTDGEGTKWNTRDVRVLMYGAGDRTRWIDLTSDSTQVDATPQVAILHQKALNKDRAIYLARELKKTSRLTALVPDCPGVNHKEKGNQYCGVYVVYVRVPPIVGAVMDSAAVDRIAQGVVDRNLRDKVYPRLDDLDAGLLNHEKRLRDLEDRSSGWSFAPFLSVNYLSVGGQEFWAPLGGGFQGTNRIGGKVPVILYGSYASTPNKTAPDVIVESGVRLVFADPFSLYAAYNEAWRYSHETGQKGRDRHETRARGGVLGLGLDIFNHDRADQITEGFTLSARGGVTYMNVSRLRPIAKHKVSDEFGFSAALNLGYNF